MLEAEATHRDHAIIEQTFSDLKAGTLASTFHAKATTATIRAQLIAVPWRIARSARKIRIHLPTNWPWEQHWQALFDAACGPQPQAT